MWILLPTRTSKVSCAVCLMFCVQWLFRCTVAANVDFDVCLVLRTVGDLWLKPVLYDAHQPTLEVSMLEAIGTSFL